jgi:hypothetical protein
MLGQLVSVNFFLGLVYLVLPVHPTLLVRNSTETFYNFDSLLFLSNMEMSIFKEEFFPRVLSEGFFCV